MAREHKPTPAEERLEFRVVEIKVVLQRPATGVLIQHDQINVRTALSRRGGGAGSTIDTCPISMVGILSDSLPEENGQVPDHQDAGEHREKTGQMSPVGNQPEQEISSRGEVARQKHERNDGMSDGRRPGDLLELQNEVTIRRKQKYEHECDERSCVRVANDQSEQHPCKDGDEKGET